MENENNLRSAIIKFNGRAFIFSPVDILVVNGVLVDDLLSGMCWNFFTRSKKWRESYAGHKSLTLHWRVIDFRIHQTVVF